MDKREIAVDTDMMHNSVRDLQDALDKMKVHKDFLKQIWQDKQKMKEFENAAERLVEYMEYAEKEYQSCENAVSSIVHTIQIELISEKA